MCTGNENSKPIEINSLLEKILLKQVRWGLPFVGLYILVAMCTSLRLIVFQIHDTYKSGILFFALCCLITLQHLNSGLPNELTKLSRVF